MTVSKWLAQTQLTGILAARCNYTAVMSRITACKRLIASVVVKCTTEIESLKDIQSCLFIKVHSAQILHKPCRGSGF